MPGRATRLPCGRDLRSSPQTLTAKNSQFYTKFYLHQTHNHMDIHVTLAESGDVAIVQVPVEGTVLQLKRLACTALLEGGSTATCVWRLYVGGVALDDTGVVAGTCLTEGDAVTLARRDAASIVCPAEYDMQREYVTSAAFSPCGTQLYVVTSRSLRIIDTETMASTTPAWGLPSARKVLTNGDSLYFHHRHQVVQCNAFTGEVQTAVTSLTGIRSVAVTTCGRYVVMCNGAVLRVYSDTLSLVREWKPHGEKELDDVATGGDVIASCTEQEIRFWDFFGNEVGHAKGGYDYVHKVVLSPDGKRVAVDEQYLVTLYNVQSGDNLGFFHGMTGVVFSPCSRFMLLQHEISLTNGDKTKVTVLDLETNATMETNGDFLLAVSPCSKVMAMARNNKLVLTSIDENGWTT